MFIKKKSYCELYTSIYVQTVDIPPSQLSELWSSLRSPNVKDFEAYCSKYTKLNQSLGLHQRENDGGFAPLHAIGIGQLCHLLIPIFVEYGTDVNMRRNYGTIDTQETSLMLAAFYNNMDAARTLLEYGKKTNNTTILIVNL